MGTKLQQPKSGTDVAVLGSVAELTSEELVDLIRRMITIDNDQYTPAIIGLELDRRGVTSTAITGMIELAEREVLNANVLYENSVSSMRECLDYLGGEAV